MSCVRLSSIVVSVTCSSAHNFKLSASGSIIFHQSHSSERSINTNMDKTAHIFNCCFGTLITVDQACHVSTYLWCALGKTEPDWSNPRYLLPLLDYPTAYPPGVIAFSIFIYYENSFKVPLSQAHNRWMIKAIYSSGWHLVFGLHWFRATWCLHLHLCAFLHYDKLICSAFSQLTPGETISHENLFLVVCFTHGHWDCLYWILVVHVWTYSWNLQERLL